jgi:murein L,D-transpeptidase YcbB/YkuD
MRRYISILTLFFLIFCFGCKKSQEAGELSPKEELVSKEEITKEKETPVEKTEPEFLPENIQKALKNAGFYTGEIDGKIGPKTIEAIKEFQGKNNLKVDGKVGPKTWEDLRKYLTTSTDVKTSEIKD